MNHSLPLLALIALASIPSDAVGATATRNFGVSSYDRVRIDGPYEVHLTVGVPPYARAKGGTNSSLDTVSIRVEGRTLIVRKATSWGGDDGRDTPVVIELGTHDLSAAWVNGAGGLQIGTIKGMTFDLNVMGAGTARVDSVDVDQLTIGIAGSGSIRLSGKTNKATAIIRGSSSLDAEGLTAKEAVLGAAGPSLVKMTVTSTAKVDAIGMAAVSLQGNAACTIKTQGSASVSGCRNGQR